MRRNPGEYLRAAGARRFRYGRHDCVQLAAGWVRLVTGADLLEGWSYDSLERGRGLLEARGFAGLEAAVDAVLPRTPVLTARVGDIALIDGALGIVTGARVTGLSRRGGLETVPLDRAAAAWRVG